MIATAVALQLSVQLADACCISAAVTVASDEHITSTSLGETCSTDQTDRRIYLTSLSRRLSPAAMHGVMHHVLIGA